MESGELKVESVWLLSLSILHYQFSIIHHRPPHLFRFDFLDAGQARFQVIRPGLGKLPHVLEAAQREPGHVRKSSPQAMRKPVDHPGAPSFLLLALQDTFSSAK